MNNLKISVVIRNKNQGDELLFLLKNLRTRYTEDIDEIIVVDNQSKDDSLKYCAQFDVKVVTIEHFSYGGSANLAAESASNDIVVVFSAHSYPVSHDFFKLIKDKFQNNQNLAGLRCIHSDTDFKNYINQLSVKQDVNRAGLLFCGSVFNRKVWENQKFKTEITTFEDKEWTKRVVALGYEIEFVPSIFCYSIKRNRKQLYFRFRNEVIGSYQLWHEDYTYSQIFKSFIQNVLSTLCNTFFDLGYSVKRFVFLLFFLTNKPQKYS